MIGDIILIKKLKKFLDWYFFYMFYGYFYVFDVLDLDFQFGVSFLNVAYNVESGLGLKQR